MSAIVLKPPAGLEALQMKHALASLFLAGSIDQDTVEDWQAAVERELDDEPVIIMNPRRDVWDPSWRQSIDQPEFRRQVEWELDAQTRADQILMYFAPGSKAPISLLELGLFGASGKMIVCNPEGFWRNASVQVLCDVLSIPTCKSLNEALDLVKQRFTQPVYAPASAAEVLDTTLTPSVPRLYLCGSVDRGRAPDWQVAVESAFSGHAVDITNPRRMDWNPAWWESAQHFEFREHLSVRLASLAQADKIFVNFTADSNASLALLELGLCVQSQKLLVCCEQGYWRKGNVDLVCERYAIPHYDDFQDALSALRADLSV